MYVKRNQLPTQAGFSEGQLLDRRLQPALKPSPIYNLKDTTKLLHHPVEPGFQAATTDQITLGQLGNQVQNSNLYGPSQLQAPSTTTTKRTQDTNFVDLPQDREGREEYLGATPGALRRPRGRPRTRINNQPYERRQLEGKGNNTTKEWQQPKGLKTAIIIYNRCVMLAMAGVTPEETSIDLMNMLSERNKGDWTTWERKWTRGNINSVPKYLDDPSKDEGERAIASNRYQLTGSQETWKQQVNLDLRPIEDKRKQEVIFRQVINWRKGLHKCLQDGTGLPIPEIETQSRKSGVDTDSNKLENGQGNRESNHFDAQMIEVTNTTIQGKGPEVYQNKIPEKQDQSTANQNSMITEKTTTASKPNTRLDTRTLRAKKETGGSDPELKISLDQNKERDREEKRHKEADLPDPRIPEAGLNPYNQPGNKIPSSGLNRITGKQELNTTRATWITKSGITILPLGGEEQGIYFGSEALPTGLLNELHRCLQYEVGLPQIPEITIQTRRSGEDMDSNTLEVYLGATPGALRRTRTRGNNETTINQTTPVQQGHQEQNLDLYEPSYLQAPSTTTASGTQDTNFVDLPQDREILEGYLGATPGALRRPRTRISNQPYERRQLEGKGNNATKEWQQPGGLKTAVIIYNRCVMLAMAGVTPEETSIDLTNMLSERSKGDWTAWERKWTRGNINSLPKYLDDPSKDEGERAIASNRYQLTGSQETWRQQVNLDLRPIEDTQKQEVIFGQVINWRKGLHKCLQDGAGLPIPEIKIQSRKSGVDTDSNKLGNGQGNRESSTRNDQELDITITEKTNTAITPNTKLDTRTLRAKGETRGSEPELVASRGKDREEKRHKESGPPDPKIPEINANPYNQPGNKIPSPELNITTGEQELNTTRSTWVTKAGVTILPLGGEKREIYFGSEALPTGLLRELQVQNQGRRIEKYELVHYDQRKNVLTTFDSWVETIHQAIPFDLARKDALWLQIQSTPAILAELITMGEYMYNDKYSFIRLVFECRKRLVRHSREEDIDQQYQDCHQRYGEKAIEYIGRLHYLRERAVGWTAWGDKIGYHNTWENHLEMAKVGLRDSRLAREITEQQPGTAQQLYDLIRRAEGALIRIARMDRVSGGLEGRPQPVGAMTPPPGLNVAKEQPRLDQTAGNLEREEKNKALASAQNVNNWLCHVDQLARSGELTPTADLARAPPGFEPDLQGVGHQGNLASWFVAWGTALILMATCGITERTN